MTLVALALSAWGCGRAHYGDIDSGAPGLDAAIDAGHLDAAIDAGALDASQPDATQPDATPPDATLDGSFDAAGDAPGCMYTNTADVVATFADHRAIDTGPFTFEAWVRSTSTRVVQIVLADRTSGTSGYLFGLYGGRPFVQLSGTPNVLCGRSVADGAWHHIAVERDGAMRLSCAVDFAPFTTSEASSDRALPHGTELRIGQDSTTTTSPFIGDLFMIRAWSVARSLEELSTSALGSVGPQAGLLFEAGMNDPSAQVPALLDTGAGPAPAASPRDPRTTVVLGCPP
ncbi:MAG: LamG domain-containing protein [Sandaracinaceae bacterium]|nr:LamG domain-containing protein [Sandaracinaceae bacterium]